MRRAVAGRGRLQSVASGLFGAGGWGSDGNPRGPVRSARRRPAGQRRLGAGRSSPATATAVCVAALSPLRTRLQRWVDQRFHPARQAAPTAVQGLRGRMDAGRARPEQLEQALREALRGAGVSGSPQVRR
ncbi:hypothetical protein GCM10014715_63800 [Streptomyces spiralis]|uniref:Uncharacterized protein n=1 Tax=Streptomyces spiralis TaxID=66376 RepID=A0A919ACL9_9ACTN|nr:hypothetical protein GCM10014715_63800 [Streptomyces spiralis]